MCMQVNMNVEVGYVHIHVGMALPEDLICIGVHMYVCMYVHVPLHMTISCLCWPAQLSAICMCRGVGRLCEVLH